jgi:hypothetical protein
MHLRRSLRPTIRCSFLSLGGTNDSAAEPSHEARITIIRRGSPSSGDRRSPRRGTISVSANRWARHGFGRGARDAEPVFRAISRLRNSAQSLNLRAQAGGYPPVICRRRFLEVQDHGRLMLLRLAIIAWRRPRSCRSPARGQRGAAIPTDRARKRGCHRDIGSEARPEQHRNNRARSELRTNSNDVAEAGTTPVREQNSVSGAYRSGLNAASAG